MTQPHETGFSVRRYEPRDEAGVLEVLSATLPRWKRARDGAAEWRWKHFGNPFGSSFLFVAVDPAERVLGVSGMMQWRLVRGERTMRVIRSVDLATLPAYQRRGIAPSFLAPSLELLREDPPDFGFHTSNDLSYRMSERSGRKRVARLRPVVRVANYPKAAMRLLMHELSGRPDWELASPEASKSSPPGVATLLGAEDEVRELIDNARRHSAELIQTDRSLEYLRWRYAEHPGVPYHAVWLEGSTGLDACAIYTLDRFKWIPRIVFQEVLLRRNDHDLVRRLRAELDRQVRAEMFQFLATRADWMPELLGGSRHLRARHGYNLMVEGVDRELGEALKSIESWGLTGGDIQGI